jgi:ATP-dependent helicase/DNAse subunit B
LSGYSPAEPDWAALHERDLDGRVTGVRWTKEGHPYKGSAVATADDFGTLRRALTATITRLTGRAATGDVAVAPYRRATDTACARCDLLAVCGFDPGAGDRYRWLQPLAPQQDPWTALRLEVDDAGAVDP